MVDSQKKRIMECTCSAYPNSVWDTWQCMDFVDFLSDVVLDNSDCIEKNEDKRASSQRAQMTR